MARSTYSGIAWSGAMNKAPGKDLLAKYLLLSTATRDTRVTASALAVLAAILERYNDREGCARPGANCLAKDTGRTRRTCQLSVELLIELDFVTVHRGKQKANRYFPRFERGVGLLSKTSVMPNATLASETTLAIASSITPEPIEGILLRNPSIERGRSAREPAADAAVPVPHPSLADVWLRLNNRNGRPLDLSELASDCRERYLRPGLPLEALRCALEQLCHHPHWVGLPAPSTSPKERRKGRASKVLSDYEDFSQVDYTWVPT